MHAQHDENNNNDNTMNANYNRRYDQRINKTEIKFKKKTEKNIDVYICTMCTFPFV